PGYIGEMIERARQEMFIDSRETGGQEIFSFRNKLLWELLYDEVQENERNKLHEKFAQIAEASNIDNPQAAANVLAYHFKKAKDAKKASDYEKIAHNEALRSFSPDEANQYLQEVLSRELAGLKEEEEEELALAVEPLKKEDYKLISEVIVSLKTGIVNYGLYPKGSKVRTDSIKELYNYLRELFKGYEVISFSEVEGCLLINGEELRAKDVKKAVADSLASLLKEYRIQSFSFEKGVKEVELDVFLAALSKKTSEIDDLGGLQAMLKQNNAAGIKLSMIHYEKILRKKLGRPQEKRRKINEVMLINYMLGKSEASADSRSSMLNMLGRNPDYLARIFSKGPECPEAAESDFDFQKMNINEKADIVEQGLKKMKSEVLKEDLEKQKQYKESLPQFILSLQPELRSQILKQKNLKNAGITADEMAKAFRERPDNEIEAFFAQECERYAQGKVNFTDIKDYIKRFLPDKERRVGILKSMSQSFAACGISDEQFLSLLKPDLWHKLSYTDKLIKIKSLSPDSFLDQDLLESAKDVFYELLSDNKEEVVNEALNKIFKNFDSENDQVRLYVAANLQSIVDILSSNDAIDCLRFTSRRLMDVMDKEKNLSIFTSETLVLGRLIGIFINKREFDLAVSITRFIKERVASGEKISEEQKNVLTEALAQIAKKENIEALAGAFKAKVKKTDAEVIVSLADKAGEETVDYFVSLLSVPNKRIDPYDAYLNRRYIAEILAKFGNKSLETLRRELSAARDVEVIMNIVEVMGAMGGRGCLETLKLYSQYSND
ncbi:MAG: hypothetical protein KAU12_03220, partial [Candidatus Omnitrophica bacterium]|nr:hypothetical protein [Candidatus Omnitrophota bacterium]